MKKPRAPERTGEIVSVQPAKGSLPVTIRGADTHDALIGWMKNELSKGTERAYDFGKFFFTVSIGTAALLATLAKDAHPLWPFLLAITFNALSAVAALALAWPKEWKLDGEADLEATYNRIMSKNLRELRRWAVFYAIAFLVSVVAILGRA